MRFSMCVIVCLFMVSSVWADSYNAVISGVWDATGTWDPVGIPQEADDVIITSYIVTLNQDEHAESLSVNGGTLNAAGHNLIVDLSTAVYGGAYLRNGNFNLSTLNLSSGWAEDGVFDVGTFNWLGGRVNDSQLNVIDGTFTSSGGSSLYLHDSTMRITGNFTQSGTGALQLDGVTTVITNQGSWSLTSDDQPFAGSGRFVNEGTFKKSGGIGTSDITVPFFDLAGTVRVDSGTIRFNQYNQNSYFSNTTFTVASGTSAYFRYGATFNGDINGSGGGVLSLGGGYDAKFYFANSCSVDMGTGTIQWNMGIFLDSILSTKSHVDLVGTGGKYLTDSTWTIAGGAKHTATGALLMTRSVLNIPVASVFDLKVDGGPISGSSSRINLAGMLSKTDGGGLTTINIPVYGDGSVLNVSTGTLSLSGSGRLDNLEVALGTNTTWRPGGVNSNVTVTANGHGNVILYNPGVTAAGLWSLTNTDVNAYFRSEGNVLYVTPSLTFEGTNSWFRFSKGQIRNGIITNRIPFEITSSGGRRYISYCDIHSFADTDVYDEGTIFQHSTWHNYTGVEHRMNVDGDIFGANDYSTYYNAGTIRKTAGSGVSGTNIKLLDTTGTIAVDTGTLWLSSNNNEFRNTQVQLASGTTFRMGGSICSNMTITAAGPATVQVASDDHGQTINTDLAITGPVSVKLLADDLTMTGAITGAEASFEWRNGKIINSKMTNAVPSLFSGTATRWINASQLTLNADTVHTNAIIYILRAHVYNSTGSVYQIASDGDILRDNTSGYFCNQGTFVKTGGNGTTDITAIFQNQEGTVGAERGLLKFTAALDFTNGEVQVSLGGVSDYGRIQSTAAVTVEGAILTVALRDGYIPSVGDSFTVLSGSSIAGSFSTTNLPALTAETFWNVDYIDNAVKLTVASPEDTDGDLLLDSWEIDKFGNISASNGGSDSHDSDVHTDYQEYIADTSPIDSNDWFHVVACSNLPSMSVYFNSSSNRFYTLLSCTNLTEGIWQPLIGPRAGIGGADSMTNSIISTTKFYKLKVDLP